MWLLCQPQSFRTWLWDFGLWDFGLGLDNKPKASSKLCSPFNRVQAQQAQVSYIHVPDIYNRTIKKCPNKLSSILRPDKMLKPEQLIRAFAVYCSACYYLMVNYLFRNLHKINIQKSWDWRLHSALQSNAQDQGFVCWPSPWKVKLGTRRMILHTYRVFKFNLKREKYRCMT